MAVLSLQAQLTLWPTAPIPTSLLPVGSAYDLGGLAWPNPLCPSTQLKLHFFPTPLSS